MLYQNKILILKVVNNQIILYINNFIINLKKNYHPIPLKLDDYYIFIKYNHIFILYIYYLSCLILFKMVFHIHKFNYYYINYHIISYLNVGLFVNYFFYKHRI